MEGIDKRYILQVIMADNYALLLSSPIDWAIFVSQSIRTILRDEGQEAADEVRDLLQNHCGPYQVRVAVLRHQLASLTIFTNEKHPLAHHVDGVRYGHIISSLTISGSGGVSFKVRSNKVFGEPIKLEPEVLYSFAGVYRYDMTHGVWVEGSSPNHKRSTILSRFWLPGRRYLVRMRPTDQDEGVTYRQLGTASSDLREASSSDNLHAPRIKPDLSSLRAVIEQSWKEVRAKGGLSQA